MDHQTLVSIYRAAYGEAHTDEFIEWMISSDDNDADMRKLTFTLALKNPLLSDNLKDILGTSMYMLAPKKPKYKWLSGVYNAIAAAYRWVFRF